MNRIARMLGIVFVFMLACSFARTHARYFYCPAMGVLFADPCASGAPAEKSIALLPLHHDCCEIVTVPSLPSGTQAGSVTVAAAPLGMIQPAPCFAPASRVFVRSTPPVRDRAPPLASERRAELMVFLT